jgi:hypothetical protein
VGRIASKRIALRRGPLAPVEGLPLPLRRHGHDRAPSPYSIRALTRQDGIRCCRPRASRASAAVNAATASPRKSSRWDRQMSGCASRGVAEFFGASARQVDQFARATDDAGPYDGERRRGSCGGSDRSGPSWRKRSERQSGRFGTAGRRRRARNRQWVPCCPYRGGSAERSLAQETAYRPRGLLHL